ncbi:hypothetical protein [Okeania sp. KiyG1]|nr:hypothetical protein [Okeania sp. KiyG1]GFZ93972.1 hypothetical protein CYANOKiyG1_04600 [Okeania sp. KiyG1]
MIIRDALDSDLDDVLSVERAAFGSDEFVEIVQLLLGAINSIKIIGQNDT